MKMKLDMDRTMCACAVGYIVLPVAIFLIGWTRLPIAIVGCVLLAWLGIRMVGDFKETEISILTNRKFWMIALGVIAVWTLFSGIGGFSYQTGDFNFRNAMFRDLCTYGYPVIYNLQEEPEWVQAYIGDAQSGMCVYYFTYWLPVACVAKLLGLFIIDFSVVWGIANVCLYLWSVLGLFLTFYCLVRFFEKYSYKILAVFALFGGLDIVCYLIKNQSVPFNTHIEWADGGEIFQYSANTTQLYWVFNQSIPIWLIIAVLLLLAKNGRMGGWCSLAFAYSPWATFGVLPLCVVAMFGDKTEQWRKRIKSAVSLENIAVILLMLIIYGTFYKLVSGNAAGDSGFILKLFPEVSTVVCYAIFVLVEFVIYFIIMGGYARRFQFYWVVFIELLLIPLYHASDMNDFCMRVSIPPLFLLMVFCIKYLLEKNAPVRRKQWLSIFLLIGAVTSCLEIQRNVFGTLTMAKNEYISDEIYSLGSIQTQNENDIEVNIKQKISFDEVYEDSFFYQYVMKK